MILIIIIFEKNSQSNEIKYTTAKNLPCGKYFILFNRGINIYNADYSLDNSLINFTSDEIISEEHDYYKKTRIVEYYEEGKFFILTLIKGSYLYIYDYNSNFLIKNITLNLESGNCYSLIPYHLKGNNLIYIISILNDHDIYFYLYMIDLSSNHENKLLNISTYNNDTIKDITFYCNKMEEGLEENSKEVLVCFYYLKKESSHIIQAIVYDIENKFKEIKKASFSPYERVDEIKSSSGDKKKSLIYYKKGAYIECKVYNIDVNIFNSTNLYTQSSYDSFEEYYFPETSQYSLIFYNKNDKSFKYNIINKDFSEYKKDSESKIFYISDCENVNGFFYVYSQTNQEYVLIYYCKSKDDNLELKFRQIAKINMTSSYKYLFSSPSYLLPLDSTNFYTVNYPTSTPSEVSENIESSLLDDSYLLTQEYTIISSIPISLPNSLISSLPFYPYSSLIYNPSTDLPSQDYLSNSIKKENNIDTTLVSRLPIDSTLITKIIIDYTTVFSNTINSEIYSIPRDTPTISSNAFINYSTMISSIPKEENILKKTLDVNKEEFVGNLEKIIDEIEIGKSYEMKGEDFNLIIKPTNSTFLDNTTHVNFSKCEEILRESLNISSSRILTFLQLEIENKNVKSLVNQVEYQVYDDNKKLLDLSLCNDTNIKVFYIVKENMLDLSLISSFQDSNIDIFNINDSFFNDICKSYSDSENDVILKDRIKYIYQNYSLCDMIQLKQYHVIAK